MLTYFSLLPYLQICCTSPPLPSLPFLLIIQIKLARPQWEDAHHIISPLTRQKEVYALKANYMNDQQLNLQERLARYNAKALADEKTSFCSGKQELDMDILRGKQPAEIQKLASPVKGQPVFFDPLNSQLDMVKKRRQEMDAENNYKWKMQDFQQSIAEIPKVAYHPATLLTQLQMGRTSLKQISRLAKVKADVWKDEDFYSQDESEMERYTSKEEGGASSSPISHAQSNKISSPQYDNSGNVLPEASLQLAMLKAKSGDTRALFNLFMVHDPNISNSQRAQQFDMLAAGSMDSLANSDFNYVGGDGNGNEGSGSAIENQNVGQVQQQIDFAQVSDQDFALTAKEQAQALALARSQSPITAGDIPILATGKGVIRSSPSSKHESIANKPNSAPTATAISKSGSLVKTPPKASTTKDVAFKKNDTEAGFRAGTEAKPKLSKLEAALLVQKEKDMVNVEENDTVIAENGTFDLQAVVPIIANPLDGVDPAITEAFFNEAANIGFTSLSLDDDASTGSLDKEESRSTRTRQIY